MMYAPVVIVGMALLFCWLFFFMTKNEEPTQGQHEFFTGRNVTISSTNSNKIELRAASPNFFCLEHENGLQIRGERKEKPLGWRHKYYYVYGPNDIPTGELFFKVGKASFITRGVDHKIELIPNHRVRNTLWFVAVFAIFYLGYMLLLI